VLLLNVKPTPEGNLTVERREVTLGSPLGPPTVYRLMWWVATRYQLYFIDFNGDGFRELTLYMVSDINQRSEGYRVYELPPTPGAEATLMAWLNRSFYPDDTVFLDLGGDGNADLVEFKRAVGGLEIQVRQQIAAAKAP
jgi:hypothetical protein